MRVSNGCFLPRQQAHLEERAFFDQVDGVVYRAIMSRYRAIVSPPFVLPVPTVMHRIHPSLIWSALASLGLLMMLAPPVQGQVRTTTEVGRAAQTAFSDICDGDAQAVRVRSGHWIDAVQLVCEGSQGTLQNRGGSGGGLHTFSLRSGEQIQRISGTYGGSVGLYIYALQIHTNQRSSPRYGEEGPAKGQRPFDLRVPDGHRFAGLTGTYGNYLKSLAVAYRKDAPAPRPSERSVNSNQPASVTFVNAGSRPVSIVWVDYEGKERPYSTLKPGERYTQSTFATHVWRIKDGSRTAETITVSAGQREQRFVYEGNAEDRRSARAQEEMQRERDAERRRLAAEQQRQRDQEAREQAARESSRQRPPRIDRDVEPTNTSRGNGRSESSRRDSSPPSDPNALSAEEVQRLPFGLCAEYRSTLPGPWEFASRGSGYRFDRRAPEGVCRRAKSGVDRTTFGATERTRAQYLRQNPADDVLTIRENELKAMPGCWMTSVNQSTESWHVMIPVDNGFTLYPLVIEYVRGSPVRRSGPGGSTTTGRTPVLELGEASNAMTFEFNTMNSANTATYLSEREGHTWARTDAARMTYANFATYQIHDAYKVPFGSNVRRFSERDAQILGTEKIDMDADDCRELVEEAVRLWHPEYWR